VKEEFEILPHITDSHDDGCNIEEDGNSIKKAAVLSRIRRGW